MAKKDNSTLMSDITRRDFLNGTLVGVGAALLGAARARNAYFGLLLRENGSLVFICFCAENFCLGHSTNFLIFKNVKVQTRKVTVAAPHHALEHPNPHHRVDLILRIIFIFYFIQKC